MRAATGVGAALSELRCRRGSSTLPISCLLSLNVPTEFPLPFAEKFMLVSPTESTYEDPDKSIKVQLPLKRGQSCGCEIFRHDILQMKRTRNLSKFERLSWTIALNNDVRSKK